MNKIRDLLYIDQIHRRNIRGRGINVAVVDTGIYPHNDLRKSIIYFHDFVNKKNMPYDDNSHGTHVSGIIAGNGAMSRGMYRGMAPDAGIIALKVLNSSGCGDARTIIKGLEWIMDNYSLYNIRIVNISIGTEASSCDDELSSLIKAVDSLWDMGITVITSAGNNGPEYHTITTPGISRKVITVGTSDIMIHTDTSGKKHITYSSKGPTLCDVQKPDIIAPGNNIVSCFTKQGGYTSKSGTSMSTPIVSGAAALVMSYNPSISNNEFKELLCRSADDAGLDRYTQGCGRLNVSKLLLLC